ncbi:single-stranded DNA-binding protein [Haloechinothrix halophila]|uniref:single-stranded DNA-binding protein n=1 Tax=Haloechinothrix halophila TaxID=1069073 RepID=UPI000410640F|nr:single-stranded DNA-binding protein [Haloechinothrix halophila]
MPIGETYLNINGRIATEPVKRELNDGGESVGFLVISTERRFSKEVGEWIDGHRCSVWVTCRRRLARHVWASLHSGDEVMVAGRLRTRQYDDGGTTRYITEVDAYAIGPNLARATATVVRMPTGSREAGSSESPPVVSPAPPASPPSETELRHAA